MGRGTGRAALRTSSRCTAVLRRRVRGADRELALEQSVIVLALDTATPAVTAGVVRRNADDRLVATARVMRRGADDRLVATARVLRRGADEQLVAQRVTIDPRGHAETLTPNVVGALADSDLTMSEVDAVVVGCGPGPFTGLRVGMATAAALGHALDIPVYGVCSLDAIGVDTRGDVLVLTDARRREVYWARYRDGARIDGPGVSAPADVPGDGVDAIAGPAAPGLDVVGPAAPGLSSVTRLDATYPTPVGLVRAVDWTAVPGPLVPLYLRRPDAKTLAERQAVPR
ncbi:MAG: tRNA (adenosine(37)-N6)-threonylcarbamoyltransferase complex dimerization subunit type 1 TsaB [Mycobacteriaceae bacterium]|nr:tRNA (adenosine(37)-N6)-threonylcarbamoyltransferase complex dimerization subunit type 1 TsaB [Mycobacteriaceae bacterium]